MIVLKIIGIVLLIIILLIGVILTLPVGIIIKNDEKGFNFFVKILFIKIPIKQKQKPKKKKPEKKTEERQQISKNKSNGLVQRILDALGISNLTNIKEDTEEKGFSETVGDLASALVNIIKQILKLFKHIRLKKLYLNCICGGEDSAETAMNYGTACAVIYPVSGYLHSIMKVNHRKENIIVQCDFGSEQGRFETEAHISVRIFFIVVALIKLVWSEYQRKLQEMK